MVDLATRRVTFSHDPSKASIDTIKGAIVEAGYDVEA